MSQAPESKVSLDWVWIDAQTLYLVHDEQLAEHGGGSGLRDQGLLESALAKPQQIAHYKSSPPLPDAADLAAAYGYAIAQNHPFIDGNKRTAFVAIELFLALNGLELTASDADCVITMLTLAAGELSEADLAAWVRLNSQ